MSGAAQEVALPADAMALAEEAAAKDRALLADIALMEKAKKTVRKKRVAPTSPDVEPVVESIRIPMNRRERRAQVKVYAAVLAATERQVPVRPATIVPRSERRRRKQHRRAS